MIRCEAVSKQYGDYIALRSVDFSAADREFVALVGPAGCGKTTLLRVMAGLETPDTGRVVLEHGDRRLFRGDLAARRRTPCVFQHPALFRHMNVYDNVAFGLRAQVAPRRLRPAEIRKQTEDMLDLLRLQALADWFPHQLSSGQAQRVTLARALALEPRVMLLDEPFAALDRETCERVVERLRGLHEKNGMTTVFVTHDLKQAAMLGDRLAVMRSGRIEQAGTAAHLHEAPATPFVCEFLGASNRITCEIDHGLVRVNGVIFPLPSAAGLGKGPGAMYIRPGDIVVYPPTRQSGMPAQVKKVQAAGDFIRVECGLGKPEQIVVAEILPHDGQVAMLQPGKTVMLMPRKLHAYRTDGP